MKKFTYSVAFVATLLATSNTFAQQGFGTNTPHRSAAVEIQSSNKGLLIPRIALTSTTHQLNASVNNATSLLIYNTSSSNGLKPGYYYWDGAKWVAFVTSTTETSTAVTTSGNDPLTVSSELEDGVTTYDVTLNAGTENQFLVSRLKENTTNEMESVWVTIGGDISAGAGYNAISVNKIKGVPVEYTGVPGNGEFLYHNGTTWTNKNFKTLVQENQKTYEVVAADNQDILTVDTSIVNDHTKYTIDIDATSLVAEGIKTANAIDTIELSAEQATAVGNGAVAGDSYVVLGGNLIKDTTIDLNEKEFLISSTSNKFKVGGLTTIQALGNENQNGDSYNNYNPMPGDAFEVMISNTNDNSVRKATAGQIAAAGLEVKNGLNIGITGTGSKAVVKLGGDLSEATTIGTSEANTLAISGLRNTVPADVAELGNAQFASVVVDKDGVLRTMEKSLQISGEDLTGLGATYKTSYEEVTVDVTLSNTDDTDITLALPGASLANNGQIINVRIVSSSENKFLIISGADQPVEGSMPHQGWVFKSTGNTWKLVARK